MSKIAAIPASITLLNQTEQPQLLTGGYKVPPAGELTIDLAGLEENRRIKVWDACNNASKGCVLAIKGPLPPPEHQQVIEEVVAPTIAAIVAALQAAPPPVP